jgi:hypothetical protein
MEGGCMRTLPKGALFCLFLGFCGILAQYILRGQHKGIDSGLVRNMFVLNLFSWVLGLAAFMIGIVGLLNRATNRDIRDKSCYVFSLLGGLSLCFLAWFFIGAIRAHGEVRCFSNLKMIHYALVQYRDGYGTLPVAADRIDFGKLYRSGIGISSEMFVCPMSGLTNRGKIDPENWVMSYKAAKEIDLGHADRAILWCPYHGKAVPVLFSNGKIQELNYRDLNILKSNYVKKGDE